MTVITCADNHLGVGFNRRRQSRDRAVCTQILQDAAGARLWMSAGSRRLFDPGAAIQTAEDCLSAAGPEEPCFVENTSLAAWAGQVTRLILYRWNRDYPADVYLGLPLDVWRLIQTRDFPGHSHETITREVYEP